MPRGNLAGLDEGPELAPDLLRYDRLQILESSASEMGVVGVERLECEPKRGAGENQREQGEEVLEASAHPVPNQVGLHGGAGLGSGVDQLPAFPYAALDRHLAKHDGEHPLAIHLQAGDVVGHTAQCQTGAIANFESLVTEGLEETFEGLGGAVSCQHSDQPAPDREVLVGIPQVLE